MVGGEGGEIRRLVCGQMAGAREVPIEVLDRSEGQEAPARPELADHADHRSLEAECRGRDPHQGPILGHEVPGLAREHLRGRLVEGGPLRLLLRRQEGPAHGQRARVLFQPLLEVVEEALGPRRWLEEHLDAWQGRAHGPRELFTGRVDPAR